MGQGPFKKVFSLSPPQLTISYLLTGDASCWPLSSRPALSESWVAPCEEAPHSLSFIPHQNKCSPLEPASPRCRTDPRTVRDFIMARPCHLFCGLLCAVGAASFDGFLTLLRAPAMFQMAGTFSESACRISPVPLTYNNLDYNWKGTSLGKKKAVSLKISVQPTRFMHQYSSLLNASRQQK